MATKKQLPAPKAPVKKPEPAPKAPAKKPEPAPKIPTAPQFNQIPAGPSSGKRNPGKEIILSFEGGQYGAVNDEAADRIAKKYNLDIVRRPEKNSIIPTYLFSVKGDVGSNLAGIGKESGVRYVEPNSRAFIPETKPDPMVQWEDNRMRAALAGEPLPPQPDLATTKQVSSNMDQYNSTLAEMQRRAQLGQFSPMVSQAGYTGAQENFPRQIPSIPTTLPQGLGQTFGIDVRQPMTPTSGQMAQQPIPTQQIPSNQQAMQNYQNFLQQGLANYQAQTYSGQGQFGSTTKPTPTSPQRKVSTPGFPTPRPLG